MATKTARARPAVVKTVDEFMKELDSPLKPALALVCAIIRGASPRIAEGIKWNCPSFFLKESEADFATVNVHVRPKVGAKVGVIFHRGAKVSKAPGPKIGDPDGILEWLGKDRAAAWFSELNEVKAKKAALAAVVHEWISQL